MTVTFIRPPPANKQDLRRVARKSRLQSRSWPRLRNQPGFPSRHIACHCLITLRRLTLSFVSSTKSASQHRHCCQRCGWRWSDRPVGDVVSRGGGRVPASLYAQTNSKQLYAALEKLYSSHSHTACMVKFVNAGPNCVAAYSVRICAHSCFGCDSALAEVVAPAIHAPFLCHGVTYIPPIDAMTELAPLPTVGLDEAVGKVECRKRGKDNFPDVGLQCSFMEVKLGVNRSASACGLYIAFAIVRARRPIRVLRPIRQGEVSNREA